MILAAGLAPTLEPPGSAAGLNDITYLDELYDAGRKTYFDALAIHTYGFTEPPDDPPAFDKLNFRRAELLRDVMVRHGDGDKPAVITETGWNDNPRWTKAVSPSQRIADTHRRAGLRRSKLGLARQNVLLGAALSRCRRSATRTTTPS